MSAFCPGCFRPSPGPDAPDVCASCERERRIQLAREIPSQYTREGKPLGVWEDIDADTYQEALEILPPLGQFHWGFLLGERYSTDEDGQPVYVAFWRSESPSGERFRRCLATRPMLDVAFS